MDYDLLNEVALLFDIKEYYKAVKMLLDIYPGNTTIEEIKKRLDEKIRIQENKIGSYIFLINYGKYF